MFKSLAFNLQFRSGNARGAEQKCSSRRMPIQIKEAFTATHFLLVSPFLVRDPPSHPISPVFRPLASLQIPYPILSRLSLERNNCSRTMHLLEALHVHQQHDANRNKNAAKRRRARAREKERDFPHLRQTFARLLIQEFFSEVFELQYSEVSLIDVQYLFQNIWRKRRNRRLFQTCRASSSSFFFFLTYINAPHPANEFHPLCNVNNSCMK